MTEISATLVYAHGFGARDMTPQMTEAEVEDLKEDLKLAKLRIEVLTRQLVTERLRNGKLTNMVHRKKAAER